MIRLEAGILIPCYREHNTVQLLVNSISTYQWMLQFVAEHLMRNRVSKYLLTKNIWITMGKRITFLRRNLAASD